MNLDTLITQLQEIRSRLGNVKQIYFDTEAQKFEYHCAKIGSVYGMNSEECGFDESIVVFHEHFDEPAQSDTQGPKN